jgi:hypothetical protein
MLALHPQKNRAPPKQRPENIFTEHNSRRPPRRPAPARNPQRKEEQRTVTHARNKPTPQTRQCPRAGARVRADILRERRIAELCRMRHAKIVHWLGWRVTFEAFDQLARDFDEHHVDGVLERFSRMDRRRGKAGFHRAR